MRNYLKIYTFFLIATIFVVANCVADKHLEDVYAEHNRIRKDHKLSTLYVDKNLEEMLQKLGFNGDSHAHPQKKNIDSYAVRVTGSIAGENWARTWNYKHTMQTLFHKGRTPSGRLAEGWMYSPGHRDAILTPSYKYMGCGIGSRPSTFGRKRDYSYTCAFMKDYKDGCLVLTSTEKECDWSSSGASCTSKTRYSPSC